MMSVYVYYICRKKRRDQYRQKREAEALALNSSSEAGTPASSRMRQSLYNLNHEFKKKAKQLRATSAEYAQATLNLVNLKTPEKRAAIMGMQNLHPCKALFVEEDKEEEAYFDIESELGIVANRGILFLSVYIKIHKAQKTYYATVIEISKDSNNFSVRFLQRSGTKYSFGEIEDVGLIASGPPDFYSWDVLNNSQWSMDHREHYTFFL
ncbi:hypothetical protein RRG08_020347 [Elysia crispata]|uniref:Uncharacterized protein n=1 Tax=Elysia crispata TaxID=231223 RepID=A0AAE1B6P5_9GAST|nr:hypothetical protein RRG08_020347 [Elysia crispata]